MEKGTKRILVIVLIIVIAGGVGVTVWLLWPKEYWVTPGVSGIPEEQWIKVGCLGDLGDIQGQANYEGAFLSAKIVNQAGGIDVDGTTYYIALGAEDTGESREPLDESLGISAVLSLLEHGAEYFIGGFRTEAVLAYREDIMDAEKLFLSTGCAGNEFTEPLNTTAGYEKYKYYFRVMPTNGTTLATQMFWFWLALRGYLNAVYGAFNPIDSCVILREAHVWTDPFNATSNFATNLALYTGMTVIDMPFNPGASADDFDSYWDTIENTHHADIVIPIISGGAGIFMASKYKQFEVPCVVGGINVESQGPEYWDETDGGAEFELTMVPLTRTNKTSITVDYYDLYVSEYGHVPLYTATGAYDAINLLTDVISSTQSFDVDDLISAFESGEWVETSGSVRKFKFTGLHDIRAWMAPGDDTDLAQTLFAQWMDDGTGEGELRAVGSFPYPYGLVNHLYNPYSFYPEGMVVYNYTLPDWVIDAWTP